MAVISITRMVHPPVVLATVNGANMDILYLTIISLAVSDTFIYSVLAICSSFSLISVVNRDSFNSLGSTSPIMMSIQVKILVVCLNGFPRIANLIRRNPIDLVPSNEQINECYCSMTYHSHQPMVWSKYAVYYNHRFRVLLFICCVLVMSFISTSSKVTSLATGLINLSPHFQ